MLRSETVEPVQPITQPGTNTNLKYLKVTKRELQSGKRNGNWLVKKAALLLGLQEQSSTRNGLT